METIYVSEISYAKASDTFERMSQELGLQFVSVVEDEAALAEAIQSHGIRGFVADIHPYEGALYEALPRGGVIARYGVGYDSIDLAKATAAGVWVANTPGVLDNAVAEHAVWLLGSLARQVHKVHASVVEGGWRTLRGFEVKGRKVAILGFGRIGQNLCKKLSWGLGMEVTGVDVLSEEAFCEVNGVDSLANLQEMVGFAEYTTDRQAALAQADFVVLLMAVVPATRGIANAEFFAAMKPGAYLINSARGALVNEGDLYDALASGALGGVALDVFEQEPYVPVSPDKDLRALEVGNVLLTPHVGSNTIESNAAMAEAAARNVATVLREGPEACPYIVNR